MTPVKQKPDHGAMWAIARWAGKVIATAALGGVTGAFAFYQTWTTMRTDVQAHGAMLKVHETQIRELQSADMDQALADAVAAATATAERESTKEQMKQIRADLQFIQQNLIGRVRR